MGEDTWYSKSDLLESVTLVVRGYTLRGYTQGPSSFNSKAKAKANPMFQIKAVLEIDCFLSDHQFI